jgi:hypothetical protein
VEALEVNELFERARPEGDGWMDHTMQRQGGRARPVARRASDRGTWRGDSRKCA